jgi:hypothetical protein
MNLSPYTYLDGHFKGFQLPPIIVVTSSARVPGRRGSS